MGTKRTADLESGVRILELEILVNAPLRRTWDALVKETGKWWRRDVLTDAAAEDFVIEPRLGGKMYEDWGNGEGVVWATVTALRAPYVLELAGVSSPSFGGPSTHYHAFRLEEHEGGTRLRFSDAVHGRVDDATASSLKEGWLLLFGEGLRPYCEASSR